MAEKPKKKTAKKAVKKSQPSQKKVKKTATSAPEKVTVQKQAKPKKTSKPLQLVGDLPENVIAEITERAHSVILDMPDVAHKRLTETIDGHSISASLSQEASRYVLTVHSCTRENSQS